ncbi:sensor histidine kinase [Hoeflea prorocentri]|uniref:histidine kinase n=1 Tax=Hoeflea prorocentri TaxID=1922333 RepID=A0A9X3UIY3_9HYPH|nr:HAMP domain-containing sensor histidine kinase [Hoeflea prorocentri]MCY6381519.1 HAMP domain-containing sensor histidine kinase [Hoeflea prorocentri]MDA5399319.1 HAMP domain-containing sensor histidine kinase [Hoeflea prorocentri]
MKRYFSSGLELVSDGLVTNWVHRDVVDEQERAVQSRLIGFLVVAGAVLASVFPFSLIPAFGAGELAAPLLILAATSLVLAGIVVHTGRRRVVEILALVAGSSALSAAAAASGGLASTLMPLALLAPAEAYRIRQDRPSIYTGFAALALIVGSVGLTQAFYPGLGAERAFGTDIGSVAVISALGIYGLLFAIGLQRGDVGKQDNVTPEPEVRDDILSRLPGLISFHNERADVVALAGASKTAMLERIGDVLGRGFIEHMHVSDRISFLQAVDDLRTGCSMRTVRVRLRRPAEGQEQDQFLHLSVHMIADRQGGVYNGFVAQAMDIGGDLEMRRAFARKVEEAETANEAKTRFLAAVSHELRTPLNAILGFSDLLSGEYLGDSLNPQQREYVELIRDSGQHLLAVINSMLDLSKIEAGRYELNLETFNVKEAMDTCEAMLSRQADSKGIVLTARVAKGQKQITACRRALQQILINLMANAIKFTEEGGIVTVDVAETNGRIVIDVSDTGIGISDADLERIGSPFVQVESELARQYEGTGLGLSLVKGLVALHGGDFAIKSAIGVGTTVTVNLPVSGPGTLTGDDKAADMRAVEFPPRLTANNKDGLEIMHDDKAKTA